jgi:hypothetical protein
MTLLLLAAPYLGINWFTPGDLSYREVMYYHGVGISAWMVLILVAGMNALVFHSFAYQSVGKWDRDPAGPWPARFAGLFSILLWFGIVAAGRWIAYV